jgi:anti-sigma factor RsiW
VKCDEVAEKLPALLDAGGTASIEVRQHIEGCLRCQAELVRYRRMLRELREMRTRFLEPSPDAMSQTLAALWEAGERRAIRSMITGRRLAYAGAVGGIVVTAAVTATLLTLRSRSRGRRRTSTVGGSAGESSLKASAGPLIS